MRRISPPPDERILAFLSTVDLFHGITPTQLELFRAQLRWYEVDNGEIFIREGRPAGSLYLIFDGYLEVFHQNDNVDVIVASRTRGETVGELSIIAGDRREASVRALSQATIARLSRNGLVRICADDLTVWDLLVDAVRRDMREDRLTQLLSTGELFAELSEQSRQDLRQELEWTVLPSGKELIRQGDEGDFLAVVVSGQLGIYIEKDDGQVETGERLSKGSVVGEMSLLTGAPRTATVRATRDSEVVKLSQKGFHHLVERHPIEMTKAIAGGVIKRLWRASIKSGPAGKIATLAVMPLAPDVPIDDFCSRLVQALAPLGLVRGLNSKVVDKSLEVEGIAQTPNEGINEGRLVAWLNAQEHHFDFVLYQTDIVHSNWSERCIRQADAVLFVGLGKGQPSTSELERSLFTVDLNWKDVHKVLVLLHAVTNIQPIGTAEWLNNRPGINGHYHLRQNNDGDYERLARYLTGRAVGVVLSGGGARGAAHVGVLRALEDAGIAVDYIGGNSAGAAVAATFALGHSTIDLPKLIKQAFKPGNFFDPTIPLYSLTSGRRGAKFYRKMFSENDIEDLWLPFFCVSANLTRATLMVHDRGPLWQAVLASNSAPGIRPPVVHDGDLLIDGGVLDDLPLDVMKKKIGGGTVVAVDVSPPVDLEENPDYGSSLSGWNILWSRLNPFRSPMNLPPITVVLQRANQLSSIHAQRDIANTYQADLYIRPPVERFSMMDYRAIDEMVEVAHEAAAEQIAAWRGRNDWNNRMNTEPEK